MQERLVTIRNKAGIHCRPSSVILNTINQEFPDHRFEVIQDGVATELNSILALISLGLSCGTQVILQVEGSDEEKAVQRVGDLFEYEFDFPEK
jgi:phosphocarrier protein